MSIDLRLEDVMISENRHRQLNAKSAKDLALSMQEIGQLQPILVTADYRLISGRHRLEAASLLAWDTIRAEVIELDDLHAELAEIDENLRRNDGTELERANELKRRKEIYEALYPETKQGGDYGNQHTGGKSRQNEINSFSQDSASKLGTSRRTVEQSVQIATDISSEVKEKITGTKLADSKTDLLALARMDSERQNRIADVIASGQAKDIKTASRVLKAEAKAVVPENMPKISKRFQVFHGDLLEVLEQESFHSVDFIITDPPYPREFLDLYESLSLFASRVLPVGGSVLVMAGQSYLPEVLEKMGKHLEYQWTLAYLTPGGQSAQLWDRHVNTFWKPVLWFTKGRYKGDWIGDVVKSEVNDNDKCFHEWGQSESGMANLIERFTYPGQTILDPFCGGGTTGLVALKTNRYFIGIDIDASAVEVTKTRLAQLG